MFIICLAATASVAAAEEPAAGPGRLHASADAANVTIAPSPEGHKFVRLPMLEFALTIEPLCVASDATRSVSVSIADTRVSIDSAEMGDQQIIETTLTLPRRQSGPLRVDGFCRDNDVDDSTRALHIEDVFTARLSLTCVTDDAAAIVYATLPLDVRLTCEAGDSVADGQSGQDSSELESPPRL
jgi:hypothetical protein